MTGAPVRDAAGGHDAVRAQKKDERERPRPASVAHPPPPFAALGGGEGEGDGAGDGHARAAHLDDDRIGVLDFAVRPPVSVATASSACIPAPRPATLRRRTPTSRPISWSPPTSIVAPLRPVVFATPARASLRPRSIRDAVADRSDVRGAAASGPTTATAKNRLSEWQKKPKANATHQRSGITRAWVCYVPDPNMVPTMKERSRQQRSSAAVSVRVPRPPIPTPTSGTTRARTAKSSRTARSTGTPSRMERGGAAHGVASPRYYGRRQRRPMTTSTDGLRTTSGERSSRRRRFATGSATTKVTVNEQARVRQYTYTATTASPASRARWKAYVADNRLALVPGARLQDLAGM